MMLILTLSGTLLGLRRSAERNVLRMDRIKAAVDDVTAAAILGEGWEPALAQFSYACGARGAVLMRGAVGMRNCAHHVLAVITTDDMAELVQAYVAGRRPPNSRYGRVQYGSAARFRVDHDDYTDAELARDPYYQEFLRPAGYFWHANLPLTLGRDEFVELSLKRRIEAGPYQRTDADALDAVVPDLLVAARLAKYTLDAEARGMARLLEQRIAPVFELDSWGRALSRHAAAEDAACPLRVIGRRLVASDRAAQQALDRAIARVLAEAGATALVPMTGTDGRRCFLQILPVPGRARDIFLSAAALAVLIDGGEPPRVRFDAATVAQAFALTVRETAVACLLTEGATLADVARNLDMQVGTVRVHLRSIFAKTGTNRQAELVALLGRLRP
jgi:DNA-binding CsgD family transcriptional regulator